ncbi:Na+/H+ antiporter [Catenuloplanes sp. NPDC051500]|uniref:Na+/H+ antiporter n=1 Tax=Catenuloplanes sp. NPDC051500 TaxID=3363959 RepID=UPI00379D439D
MALEIVVVLGATVLLCNAIAGRLRVAPPVLLLGAGALIGLVPAFHEVRLPPDVMLLLFLPALLYVESLTTSLREIRYMLRVVLLMSTVLVVATAGGVAWIAHEIGLAWGPAWVLGAALAPTDATAVGVLARALPRRTMTVLRAESLINDGTALVLYGVAVALTIGEETLSLPHIGFLFAVSYVGGVLVGLVVAGAGLWIRAHLDRPMHENLVSLLTPFTSFLLAELFDASGVLAVVVAGLVMSQVGPRVMRADTRQQAFAFWQLSTFALNGALFVLVGLQITASVRDLPAGGLAEALIAVGVISAGVVGVRFLWSFTLPYLLRAVDRRPSQRERRSTARSRVVMSVAGFRGAVSMAAALAVPVALRSGEPFPDRELIIFVTSGVIAVTLVVGGLALPAVVRWARLPEDTEVEEETHLAEREATRAAIEALPEVAERMRIPAIVAERLRLEYEQHLSHIEATDNGDADALDALRLEMVQYKRMIVVGLRDDRRIDDIVLRRLQLRLDIEELRLANRGSNDGD